MVNQTHCSHFSNPLLSPCGKIDGNEPAVKPVFPSLILHDFPAYVKRQYIIHEKLIGKMNDAG